MAISDYNNLAQQIYIAYFGRPADKTGLLNMATTLSTANLAYTGTTSTDFTALVALYSSNATFAGVMNNFDSGGESATLYGSIVTGQPVANYVSFVTAVFNNVLGRPPVGTATDATTGLGFWCKALSEGRMTAAQAALNIMQGAVTNTTTQGLVDGQVVANKTTVAASFTTALATTDTYAGATDAATARTWLSNVDETAASVTTASGTMTATINTINDVGQTSALTTGADTITGTALNDTITATVTALSSTNNLNVTDAIDGGAGTDTLNVALSSNSVTLTTGSIKNVENINLTNSAAVTRTFDATKVTGVTQYTIDGTTGSTILTNLAATTGVTLNNQASGAFSTAMDAAFVALAGTADAMTFTVKDVGATSTVTATLTDIETINLVSNGTANVVTIGGTATTLNISGAGKLTVSAVDAALTVFDATASTGGVTANLTAATGAYTTVAGGAGNDAITFDEVDAAANAVLAGGAGTDTLTLNSDGGTVQYTMTGFETVALNTITTAPLTISGTNTTGITDISSVAATAQAVSFVNMGAVALAVTGTGATVDAGDISSSHTGLTTLNYAALAASVTAKTAQTPLADYTFAGTTGLTVNVGQYIDASGSDIIAAAATSVELNIASGMDSAATPAETTKFGGTITAAAATSLTVTATGQLAGTITAAKATSATIGNGVTAGALTLTAAALTDLTVTTGNTLDFTGSTLTGVQNASLTTTKGLLTTTPLTSVSTLTLAGTGTTSAINTGNLGSATQGYSLTATATGLKSGLTVGNNRGQTPINRPSPLAPSSPGVQQNLKPQPSKVGVFLCGFAVLNTCVHILKCL